MTLVEAHKYGLPVAMYELPWLETVQNGGVISVKQFDARGLAKAIFDLIQSPEQYKQLSDEALANYKHLSSYDYHKIYQQLLTGKLASQKIANSDKTAHMRLLAKFNEIYYRDAIGRASRAATRKVKRSETFKIARILVMPARIAKKALKKIVH